MALQIRRGTNAERQQIIPLDGELLFTTDTKKLWVGDNVTQGGVEVDTLGSGADGNTTYTISAETATGGVDLRLTGSDASTDNVKLAAGANVTVSRTDANTITIAATGGGASNLDDLGDVVITGTPTNGQVLKYLNGEWSNAEEAIPVFSVVSDESPNLGGSLNLNEFEILGTGNIDIVGDITISGILSNGDFSVTSNSVSVGASATLNFTDVYDINFTDEREESINEDRVNIEFNSTDLTRTLRISRYSPTGDFHNKIIGITQGNSAAGNVYETSNGTILEPTALVPGDAITVNAALGYDGDVTEPSYVISSLIRQSVDVNGVVSPGAVPGRIELLTIADGSLNSTKGLIVDSRGFVSINKGDNIATAELDVLGSVKASVSLIPGVYADTAARDTAIPTPTAGMIIFVTDVTKFQGYNGTAWVDLN
jgi:hypothetical protein